MEYVRDTPALEEEKRDVSSPAEGYTRANPGHDPACPQNCGGSHHRPCVGGGGEIILRAGRHQAAIKVADLGIAAMRPRRVVTGGLVFEIPRISGLGQGCRP